MDSNGGLERAFRGVANAGLNIIGTLIAAVILLAGLLAGGVVWFFWK